MPIELFYKRNLSDWILCIKCFYMYLCFFKFARGEDLFPSINTIHTVTKLVNAA
jgi:hypothetical protein